MNDAAFDALLHRFAEHHGTPASFAVRAPGRVNLIGEHTDYNGLPVLPMAIDRGVRMVGRRRDDDVVRLSNLGSFGDREFTLVDPITPYAAGDWGNYVKAAAQGLRKELGGGLDRGVDLVVAGDVPDGAGLSSSSALVVASALALLAANDIDVPYPDLADWLPRAEQYVGTLSGGMDQTISLLGQAGHALRIDFRPLRQRLVPLPEDYVFVVANSLVHADKSGAARAAYNQRVLECRLAAQVAAHLLQLDTARPVELLADVFAELAPPRAAAIVARMEASVPPRALTFGEIALLCDTDPAELRRRPGLERADETGRYALLARARHVLYEAERVDDAEQALLEGAVDRFAWNARASHASCRDNYEISCPELEELVAIAEASGAEAARLTGAGFGGCIVAFVPRDGVAALLAGLDGHYYARRGVRGEALDRVRFPLQPAAGAEVVQL